MGIKGIVVIMIPRPMICNQGQQYKNGAALFMAKNASENRAIEKNRGIHIFMFACGAATGWSLVYRMGRILTL